MDASDDRPVLIKGLSFRDKVMATRRDSLNAEFGDDDDMEEEWGRLSMAQNQLQRELSTFMKMVDIMQAVDEDDNGDGVSEDELRQSLQSMGSSARSIGSSFSYDGRGLSILVEEEEPTGRKKTFARGFFELVKPKETLEAQKKRKMEIVQQHLKTIDPDLEHEELENNKKQETFVQQTKETLLQKQKQIEKLKNMKTNTLEEEKKRLMEILKLNLSSLDPGLEDIMTCQNETQDLMIQQKMQELEETQGVLDDMNESLRTSTNFRDSSMVLQDSKPAKNGFFGFRQKK